MQLINELLLVSSNGGPGFLFILFFMTGVELFLTVSGLQILFHSCVFVLLYDSLSLTYAMCVIIGLTLSIRSG